MNKIFLDNPNFLNDFKDLFGIDIKKYQNIVFDDIIYKNYLKLNDDEKILKMRDLIIKIDVLSDFIEVCKYEIPENILIDFKNNIELLSCIYQEKEFVKNRHLIEVLNDYFSSYNKLDKYFSQKCKLWIHLFIDRNDIDLGAIPSNWLSNDKLPYKILIDSTEYSQLYYKKLYCTIFFNNTPKNIDILETLIAQNIKNENTVFYVFEYLSSNNIDINIKKYLNGYLKYNEQNINLLNTLYEKYKINKSIENIVINNQKVQNKI